MSDDLGPDPRQLARLIRQRTELGGAPVFLQELDRAAVAELLRSAARGGSTGGEASGGSSVGTASGNAGPRPAEPRSRGDAIRAAAGAGQGAKRGATGGASTRGDGARVDDGAGAPPDVSEMDYETLEATCAGCTRCRLAKTRTQVVFSDGNPGAEVMVVGEAPGANEDATGLPFVGAAGRLLDLMLASVDLSRERNVYICNTLKCRPPGNRNPKQDELDACAPWLHRQIELVEPRVILAVGTFAGQLLTGHGDRTLGALRGEVHSYRGVPLVVTYHPAALLRNGSWTRPTWDDLQLLRHVMDSHTSTEA